MAFRPKSTTSGQRVDNIISLPITAGKAVNKGSIVYFDNANNTVELVGADPVQNTKIGCYITLKTSTATDTFTTIPVVLIGASTVIEGDIYELSTATVLTATSGNATTFVDDSFVGAASGDLIGATFQVMTLASNDVASGSYLTATDYLSDGTFTFASIGSTGFAVGDTLRLATISDRIVGSRALNIPAASDYIKLDAAAVTTDKAAFKVVGTSGDKKKVLLVPTFGPDQAV